ncbi:MAG: S-methyl-5-thioribose kinase [Nitriliruptoraceae bacterium]|nr:S-methyl-5-thioribose kinase [Nitriliruptoraceae bacterium]
MTQHVENLTPETVGRYLASVETVGDLIDVERIDTVEEIGDGNLNLVFIVTDLDGRSLVVKQALPYVRLVGPEWPMTIERIRHEAESLRAYAALSPEHVPTVHHYDEGEHVIVMEDLSDHQVWRHAMNADEQHEGAAGDMGRFVARVAFGTSVFGMHHQEQKHAVARSINPELCEITEDLVFTEPYVDAGRNEVIPANEIDARELAEDAEMVAEMGALKWRFMTCAQALIHGDLHTGSVMVRAADGDQPRSTKAFDSEFAFYGPIGFDLGALWGNYLIAAARAFALGHDDRAAWTLGLLDETWRAFDTEFRSRWPERLDPRVYTDPMLERFLAELQVDAAGFAAAKMARRIVGLAKNADIETLPEDLREGAARGVLRSARRIARERHSDASGTHLAELTGQILVETRTT